MVKDSRSASHPVGPSEFAAYLDAYPATRRCWRLGPDYLYPMLAWVDTMAVVTLKEGFDAMGDAGLRLGLVIHNQSGTVVAWSLRHLSGTLAGTGQWSRYSIWELARRRWVIRNLLADVFQGARGFEVSVSARGTATTSSSSLTSS